jgi:phthalate 3,4-cis-dihydrodiol dehydrogenase
MGDWLTDKRVLVIGAGSGIGRAVVDRYLEEGARVGVLERDPEKCRALQQTFPQMPIVAGDASLQAPNEEAVAACVTAFGGLDVLVSCVGVFDFYRSIVDLDAMEIDQAFADIFNVNVRSCLHSVKAALPALAQSSAPAVILTESTSAYFPGRGGALYVSSKFAVRGLVMALAHDLAPDIRVNAVAPGGTLGTDLRGVASLGNDSRSLGDAPGRAEDLASRVALRVALSGADHAWSYVFLASEHSRGMTGQSLHSDGGTVVSGSPRKRS